MIRRGELSPFETLNPIDDSKGLTDFYSFGKDIKKRELYTIIPYRLIDLSETNDDEKNMCIAPKRRQWGYSHWAKQELMMNLSVSFRTPKRNRIVEALLQNTSCLRCPATINQTQYRVLRSDKIRCLYSSFACLCRMPQQIARCGDCI